MGSMTRTKGKPQSSCESAYNSIKGKRVFIDRTGLDCALWNVNNQTTVSGNNRRLVLQTGVECERWRDTLNFHWGTIHIQLEWHTQRTGSPWSAVWHNSLFSGHSKKVRIPCLMHTWGLCTPCPPSPSQSTWLFQLHILFLLLLDSFYPTCTFPGGIDCHKD